MRRLRDEPARGPIPSGWPRPRPGTEEVSVATHKVVAHEAWVEARKKHLAKEKEFTRLRDQLSRERRELPWELIEKDYVFEGERGQQSLADLFEGRGQLVIYHAM